MMLSIGILLEARSCSALQKIDLRGPASERKDASLTYTWGSPKIRGILLDGGPSHQDYCSLRSALGSSCSWKLPCLFRQKDVMLSGSNPPDLEPKWIIRA